MNVENCSLSSESENTERSKDVLLFGTKARSLISEMRRSILCLINQINSLEQMNDMYESKTHVKEIDTRKEEKTEVNEIIQEDGHTQEETNHEEYGKTDSDPPVDSMQIKQETEIELEKLCITEASDDDDYTHEHSSDEANDNGAENMIIVIYLFCVTCIWRIVHATTDEPQDRMLKEAPPTEDFRGHLEEGINPHKMKNVGKRTDRADNLPIKTIKSWTERNNITATLPKELCNLNGGWIHGKGSIDENKWYLMWPDNHLPWREFLITVFALPFSVSSRIVPLSPRRYTAQNNSYRYECVRLASFSRYRGRGFGVVFARAGFVFDPATNMVMCPWCIVFVYDMDVSIRNIHHFDCMILQRNIPLHNVPRTPGRVQLSSTPAQVPNRQSIDTSCSRVCSDQTLELPVTETTGVRLENAVRVSTNPSMGENSYPATPSVSCSGIRSEQSSGLPVCMTNDVRPRENAMMLSRNPSIGENSHQAAPSVSFSEIRSEQTLALNVTVKDGDRSEGNAMQKFSHGLSNHHVSQLDAIAMPLQHAIPSATMEATREKSEENGSEVAEDSDNKATEMIPALTEGAVNLVEASCFRKEDTRNYFLPNLTQSILTIDDQLEVVIQKIKEMLLKWGKYTKDISTFTEDAVGLEETSISFFCQKETRNYLLSNVTPIILKIGEELQVLLRRMERMRLIRGQQKDMVVGRALRNGHSSNPAVDVKMITTCKICQENTTSLVFLRCCQTLTCQDCSSMYRKCPICKTRITRPE